MNEFKFELNTPVKYSYKGEDLDASFITMTEPSIKHLDLVSEFKKAFFYAAGKVAQDSTESSGMGSEKSDVTGDQIMALLYQNFPDIKQLFGIAKKLFFSVGIAQVEGVVDFNKSIYDTMTIDDFEKMIGEYLVNFILASALNQEN